MTNQKCSSEHRFYKTPIQKSEAGALALPGGGNSMEKSLKTERNKLLLGIKSRLFRLEHSIGVKQAADKLGKFFKVGLRDHVLNATGSEELLKTCRQWPQRLK